MCIHKCAIHCPNCRDPPSSSEMCSIVSCHQPQVAPQSMSRSPSKMHWSHVVVKKCRGVLGALQQQWMSMSYESDRPRGHVGIWTCGRSSSSSGKLSNTDAAKKWEHGCRENMQHSRAALATACHTCARVCRGTNTNAAVKRAALDVTTAPCRREEIPSVWRSVVIQLQDEEKKPERLVDLALINTFCRT